MQRHASLYREHFVEIAMRKEDKLCDLLRRNDQGLRHLTSLRRQADLWRRERGRLEEKLNRVAMPRAVQPVSS